MKKQQQRAVYYPDEIKLTGSRIAPEDKRFKGELNGKLMFLRMDRGYNYFIDGRLVCEDAWYEILDRIKIVK